MHDFAGRFDRHPALYSQIRGDDVPQELLDASRGEAAQRIAEALGASTPATSTSTRCS